MSLQDKPRINTRQMVQRWNSYAKKDSLWIILTDPDKKDGKWSEEEFFETGRKNVSSVMDWLRSAEIEFSKERALDFGCGVGRLTQALCEAFDRCDGVDISAEMVAQAEGYNKYGSMCRYHVNESDRLEQFETGSFSFVFTAIVLQHIHPEYSKKYLQEFVRILKPGGVLVFQLPVQRLGAGQALSSTEDSSGTGLRKCLGKVYYGFRGFQQELSARVRSRLRFAKGAMDVEMHGLPKGEVVALMRAEGARLLLDKEDTEVANGWESNWYVFRKNDHGTQSG